MRLKFVVSNLHLKAGGSVIAFLSPAHETEQRRFGDPVPRVQGGIELVVDDPKAHPRLMIGHRLDVEIDLG